MRSDPFLVGHRADERRPVPAIEGLVPTEGPLEKGETVERLEIVRGWSWGKGNLFGVWWSAGNPIIPMRELLCY